jgi:lycopene beta-cyclase
VFNPAVATLFDFRTAQGDGSRFVYVVPVAADQALVEVTEFVPRSAAPPTPADRRASLSAYLADVLRCGDVEVMREESAVIALRTAPTPRRRGRVLAIGAGAGLVKASTGYAYQRVQRDSRAVAGSLRRFGHPFAVPGSHSRHRLLDAALLAAFDRDPSQLERAFARLMFGNPVERVLRFLDEDSRVPEELRLIATLPPAPYLRAIAQVLRSPRRSPVPRAVHPTDGPGPPRRRPADRASR